jgi:hypothetical protein
MWSAEPWPGGVVSLFFVSYLLPLPRLGMRLVGGWRVVGSGFVLGGSERWREVEKTKEWSWV